MRCLDLDTRLDCSNDYTLRTMLWELQLSVGLYRKRLFSLLTITLRVFG